jgi:hypothetical protein
MILKKNYFCSWRKEKNFSGRGDFYHFFRKDNVVRNLFNKVLISVQRKGYTKIDKNEEKRKIYSR